MYCSKRATSFLVKRVAHNDRNRVRFSGSPVCPNTTKVTAMTRIKNMLKNVRPTVNIEAIDRKWLITVLEAGKMVYSEACDSREQAILKLETFLQKNYIS